MSREKDMFKIVFVLAVFLTISVVANIYLYSYWYANEYPSGSKQIKTNVIEFFKGGWYCDEDYVSFGGKDVYQILDFDIEKELLGTFNNWHNVNYSIVYSEQCEGEEMRIYNIYDYREFSFEIEFHTYDYLEFGNTEYYSKQKVIDDFRIAGWKS